MVAAVHRCRDPGRVQRGIGRVARHLAQHVRRRGFRSIRGYAQVIVGAVHMQRHGGGLRRSGCSRRAAGYRRTLLPGAEAECVRGVAHRFHVNALVAVAREIQLMGGGIHGGRDAEIGECRIAVRPAHGCLVFRVRVVRRRQFHVEVLFRSIHENLQIDVVHRRAGAYRRTLHRLADRCALRRIGGAGIEIPHDRVGGCRTRRSLEGRTG